MLSNRPYLLRAFYQWITDSNCTPILVIDATNPRCRIPQDYAEGGEIVFNISSVAVRDLKISNDLVEFKASFAGVIHLISAPMKAILAIYADENGEGLFFDAEENDGDEASAEESCKPHSIEEVVADDVIPLKGIESNTNQSKNDVSSPSSKSKQKPFLKLVE